MAPHVVRRIAALLIVDAESPPAEGDVAAAVAALRSARGDVEPIGPQAVVAVFDDVTEAAHAATALHAGERARMRWRGGLHVGEVLLANDTSAGRDAIARATALARMARPGTTAVAADAASLLGRPRAARFESVTPTLDGTHVLLVVPSSDLAARRRALALLAGGAAVGVATVLGWLAVERTRRAERAPLTLGVGRFHVSGSPDGMRWIGAALRSGLNARLSELDGVRVYSQEFMDFVMSRERLTTMELATRLGLEKMVTGSVVTVGDTVRVEARVIDVASGLIEGSHVASGRQDELLSLARDVAAGVVAKLDLRLSPEETGRFAAERATDQEALRRLLDAEGDPEAPSPPNDPLDPRSGPSWNPLAPRAAWADDASAEVVRFLEAYRRATEARDLDALAGLYADFSDRRRNALARYFENVHDLRVGIDRIETAIVGQEAVVTYTRTDRFTDVRTARPQEVSVRLTKTLRRVGSDWRFSDAP